MMTAKKIESWVTAWVKEHDSEISKLISDSVFGSNDFKNSEQIFGTWLNSWGVFKFTGTDGEYGVVVCHATDDTLRIDRKARTFSSEAEYLDWYNDMVQFSNYGDAWVLERAIRDIEGEV